MRKLLAVLLILVMSSCAEGVMLFEVPGRNRSGTSTFELAGGLSVEFCGIVRDLEAEGDLRECVFTLFLVTVHEDMQLSVSSDAVYNVLGRKFPDYLGASVAGNADSSEIIAGFPTLVWFVHRVPVMHGELPRFSRMSFMFNGQSVELRGKSSEKWQDWKKDAAVKSEQLGLWAESCPDLSAMYPQKYDAGVLENSRVFNGHHYRVFTSQNKTCCEAEAACREMGGHLALIDPADPEKDKSLEFIYRIFPSYKSGQGTYIFWMGRAGDQCQCVLLVDGGRKELITGIQANTVTDGYVCEWDY